MLKILNYLQDIWASNSLRKKILFTLAIIAVYRLFVFIPVPFVNIEQFMLNSGAGGGSGLEFFAMLLGGTLEHFSIIAVGLVPFINASIIMQLLISVLPQLEDLQEQGEVGTMKIQQYTRWLTLPFAFLQSIGMVYFMNYLFNGAAIIDVASKSTVLLAAFALTVGTVLLMWLGELITEKGISNGISLIIFSSIVSGITSKVYSYTSASVDLISIVIFMLLIVGVLIVLAAFLVRTKKEIPITYARHGKVEETSSLPIPLNPVGMVPIIFAIAFVSFPYLLSQMIVKFGTQNEAISGMATWISNNFNIYTETPSIPVIIAYFLLIMGFTYFYTMIIFNPEKIADNVQKKGGFIPGIRPGEETSKYINRILMHLCLWGGMGLGFIGIYTYILSYIPFIQQATQSIGSIPVVVTGSGVIIIVGVIQDLLNKLNSELLMERYDRI